MSRHYYGPKYVPMFDVDDIVMNFTGTYHGDEVHFEGGSAALPGVRFTTVLTAINDIDAPPPVPSGLTASATGSIRSTSVCSTVSMAATAVS